MANAWRKGILLDSGTHAYWHMTQEAMVKTQRNGVASAGPTPIACRLAATLRGAPSVCGREGLNLSSAPVQGQHSEGTFPGIFGGCRKTWGACCVASQSWGDSSSTEPRNSTAWPALCEASVCTETRRKGPGDAPACTSGLASREGEEREERGREKRGAEDSLPLQ